MLGDLPKKDVEQLSKQISPIYKQIKENRSPFFESHVSANTFLENKYGYPENLQRTRQFTFCLQKRHFKTYRSDVNVVNQGPSVADRLRLKLQLRNETLMKGDKIKGIISVIYLQIT